MRVLVCGGRGYQDFVHLSHVLNSIHEETPITAIVNGGAPGADSMSTDWAKDLGIPIEVYPADWHKHGKAAGPIRNKIMLEEGDVDLVVAFPGGVGTASTTMMAVDMGIPVWCAGARGEQGYNPVLDMEELH